MNMAAWVSLVIFVTIQTGSLIWYLATVSANIKFLANGVKTIENRLERKLSGIDGEEIFYRKDEAERQISKRNEELAKLLFDFSALRDRLHNAENATVILKARLDMSEKRRRTDVEE